jgi:hypothetical protein
MDNGGYQNAAGVVQTAIGIGEDCKTNEEEHVVRAKSRLCRRAIAQHTLTDGPLRAGPCGPCHSQSLIAAGTHWAFDSSRFRDGKSFSAISRAASMRQKESVNTRAKTQAFLAGGGEMGALIRAYDWSRHPLGAPEAWQSAPRVFSLPSLPQAGEAASSQRASAPRYFLRQL